MTFTVKLSWLALTPHGRMDARYWREVVDALRAADVETEGATLDQVRVAIATVAAAQIELAAEAARKRAAARALIEEARALERGLV